MTHIFRAPVLIMFVLCALLLVPSESRAQSLPTPILRMSDALDKLPASRGDSTATFTLTESGRKVLSGKIKGSAASGQGLNADVEGKFSIDIKDLGVGGLLSGLLGKKTFSLALEFKIMPMNDEAYFRFTKGPTRELPDFKSIVKKWIRMDLNGADLSESSSAASLSAKEVLAALGDANGRYPAFVFTERTSTKKEYVYDYRVYPAQLFQFINETKRLSGEEAVYSAEQISRMASQFKTITGTLAINKSSYLPTRITYHLTYADFTTSFLIDGATTYSYGKAPKIKKPSSSIDIEELTDL